MATLAEVNAHFEEQANACDSMGSPFTARVCRALARTLDGATATGGRVTAWPGDPRADALSLRLCGALNGLVLAGTDAALASVYPPHEVDDAELTAALVSAIPRHDAALVAGLTHAPQTNEIARSGVLLPGLLAVARATGLPLSITEIGSSAGLNLLLDRFNYRYGEQSWGDESSPVRLEPKLRGAVPDLTGALHIAGRRGCDIAPLDIRRAEDRQRLRSYVWPDQPLRLQRLDAAISLALADPPALVVEDALAFVTRSLTERREGETFVLMHSIMWQYLPAEAQRAIQVAMAEAGALASAQDPVAWVRMEPLDLTVGPSLLVTVWPGGKTRRLAACDAHGRWIDWFPGEQ